MLGVSTSICHIWGDLMWWLFGGHIVFPCTEDWRDMYTRRHLRRSQVLSGNWGAHGCVHVPPDHCPSPSAPGHVLSQGFAVSPCTLQHIGVKGTEGVAGNKAGKEAGLWCCQNIPNLLGQQYKYLFHWPWWSCVEFPLMIPRQSQALVWSNVPAAVSLPPPTPK